MKRYTDEDIASYIIDSPHMMFEDGLYYAHVDESGELVYSARDAEANFTVPFDASEWEEDEGPGRFLEEVENTGNRDFMFVCWRLATEINEYLDELDED